jgi:hypothetical protein
MTEQNQPQVDPAPIKLVFILDGRVQEVLATQDRLAAILLSEPLVLDVSDRIKDTANGISMFAKYDYETGNFTHAKYDEDGNLID